jgi:hypothetical protein
MTAMTPEVATTSRTDSELGEASDAKSGVLRYVPLVRPIGLVLQATLGAFGHPRVLLMFWLLVTVPALFLVWPMHQTWSEALGPHPGAAVTALDQALDVDLARRHPDRLRLWLGGSALLVLFGAVVIGGGLLRIVGRKEPFRALDVLVEGCRGLLRNTRVLLIGLLVALAFGWGSSALRGWMGEMLRDVEAGAVALGVGPVVVRWYQVFGLLGVIEALLFCLVLFWTKVAMARLVLRGRRSSIGAMTRAGVGLLRFPFTTAVCVVGPVVIAFVGASALGELQVRFLEAWSPSDGVIDDPWIAFALAAVTSQLAVLWTLATLVVGYFLLARRFALLDGAANPPRTVLASTGQVESVGDVAAGDSDAEFPATHRIEPPEAAVDDRSSDGSG